MKGDDAYTTLLSGTTQLAVSLALVNLDTGQTRPAVFSTLRPGVDPYVAVVSAYPAAGVVHRSPVRLDQLINGFETVDFQPLALGDTEVVAAPPPGLAATRSLPIHVTLPAWDISVSFQGHTGLGKDTAMSISFSLASNVRLLADEIPITIQSSYPSRLLVSSDPLTPGAATIFRTLAANSVSPERIYVQALGREGSARLTVTAPGFADSYVDIPLADTFFGMQSDFPLTNRISLRNGIASGTVGFGTARNVISENGGSLRPGTEVSVRIESSDPSILAIETPIVTVRPDAPAPKFTVRPLRTGNAVIRLVPPEGFSAYPPLQRYSGAIDVTVTP
jgi:hypothetical protein